MPRQLPFSDSGPDGHALAHSGLPHARTIDRFQFRRHDGSIDAPNRRGIQANPDHGGVLGCDSRVKAAATSA
jgi:hypothetical protein